MTDETEPPALQPGDALFLDFDGTLAPIQEDPDAVQLPDGADTMLTRLADRLGGRVAIISGRDIDDLSSRVPASLWRLGNHGMNVLPPGDIGADRLDHAPEGLFEAFEGLRETWPGLRLEPKGAVLAVHHRNHPDIGPALRAAGEKIVSEFEGYKVQAGKMIIEAKPADADKGSAIRAIMQRPAFAGHRPVMAGDDVTDEDGFAAVLDLGGFAVKVGTGETCAPHRLASLEALSSWLEREPA